MKVVQPAPFGEPEEEFVETRRCVSTAASDGAPPDSIAGDTIATIMLAITSVGFAISMAALIFAGELEAGLPRALCSFLFGSGLLAILVARRSQIVPVATFAQEGPAILMAVVAADFVARQKADVSDVFVLLVVTMLATSLIAALLAHLELGKITRCLPRPVVSAFAGGTGWLLLTGGFGVMTNQPVGLGDLLSLLDWDLAQFWLPGVVVGVIAWLASRSPEAPPYALGLVIGVAVVAFYLVVELTSSVSAARASGWTLGPFPKSDGKLFVAPGEFRDASWFAIVKTTPGILSVAGVACASQMFNLTGLRSVVAPDLDIDAEMRSSSLASLATALVGTVPGFQGFGYTVMLHRFGAKRRAVSVVAGFLTLLLGVFGVAAIGYVPRLVIGALLVMIGIVLLDDWRQGLAASPSTAERWLGVAVVAAIAWLGLLEGTVLGLGAASLMFIVSYGRIDPVRTVSNGALVRSAAGRPAHEIDRLAEVGDRLTILELRGYLFFGSFGAIEKEVRAASVPGTPALQALVLDFDKVTGIDSSSFGGIAQLVQDSHRNGVAVWVSALDLGLADRLLATDPDVADSITLSSSLDAAIQGAENHLLTLASHQSPRSVSVATPPLTDADARCFLRTSDVMTQGQPSKGVLLITQGRIAAYRVQDEETEGRLQRCRQVVVVGKTDVRSGVAPLVEGLGDGVIQGNWLSADGYYELHNTKPWLIFAAIPVPTSREITPWAPSEGSPVLSEGSSLVQQF